MEGSNGNTFTIQKKKKEVLSIEVKNSGVGKHFTQCSSDNNHAVKAFTGVRRRHQGRISADIRDHIGKCRHWLGTYDTTEEASKAYDAAAIRLRG